MPFTTNQAFELLKHAHANGRMPHALLVTGAPECGTNHLALQLAALLCGAKADKLEDLMHPNCRVIRPGSKIRTITIDAIRSVEPFLTLCLPEGETKLVIICEADRLSAVSSNSFLKTLEEPPPQTLIVLITELPSRLLPTIRSRCIRLDIAEFALGEHVSETQQCFLPAVRTALANLGSDVAALALRCDFQKLLADDREEISDRITSAVKAEAKSIAEGTDVRDWEAQQKDTMAAMIETEYLARRTQMLELLTLCLGQAVLVASHAPDVKPVAPEIEAVAHKFPVSNLIARMRMVDELQEDLNYNVQEALTLDARFTQIIGSSPL